MNTLIARIPAQVRNSVTSLRVVEFFPLDADPNQSDDFERYLSRLDRELSSAFPNAHLSIRRAASMTSRGPSIEVFADNDDNEQEAMAHAQLLMQAISYDAFGF